MEFLQSILRNSEVMTIYNIIMLLAGIMLVFCHREESTFLKSSRGVICIANAFLWGSMILFRFYYNEVAFLLGGLFVVAGTVLLCLWKRNCIQYLFVFWCFVNLVLVVGNYVISHNTEKQDEMVFLTAGLAALIVSIILFWVKCIPITRLMNGAGVFYGACIITGIFFNYVHDVSTSNLKFLFENKEYINFYKSIFKADWTTENTGAFWGILCLFIGVIGMLWYYAREGKANRHGGENEK